MKKKNTKQTIYQSKMAKDGMDFEILQYIARKDFHGRFIEFRKRTL